MTAPLEKDEQIALFDWLSITKHKGMLLGDYAFAIPNGAWLPAITKARIFAYARSRSRQGLKSGVPDILIALPSLPYHGLFIELKRIGGLKPMGEQVEWHKRLSGAGYCVKVCFGFEEARKCVMTYLGMRETR